jgi:subtilase family serine protease
MNVNPGARSTIKINNFRNTNEKTDFVKAKHQIGTPGSSQNFYNGKDLASLYNVPSVKNLKDKRKTKIGIIGWGHYPQLIDDLKIFWKANFPKAELPSVKVKTMPGAVYDETFVFEGCLDLQTVCSINPNADIYVIEASSNSLSDLAYAIKYATETLNIDVISMSWGSHEFIGSMFIDPVFTNTNVCYCASTGDSFDKNYPSTNPNVISVGGTAILPIKTNSRDYSEYTWSSLGYNGGGDGYSTMYEQPSYQKQIPGIDHKYRATPDVSLLADPSTGLAIYCSDISENILHEHPLCWNIFGGTSLSCPLFAGIVSIANQLRFNLDKPPLTSVYNSNIGINSKPTAVPSNHLQTAIYNIPGIPNATASKNISISQSGTLSKLVFNNLQIPEVPSTKTYTAAYNYLNCFNDINGKNLLGGTSFIFNDITEKYERVNTRAGYDLATGLGSPNADNFCKYLSTI